MIRENDMVYICSPLSAPTANEIRANMELARSYMQLVSKVFRCRAVAPHAYLPELLDDRVLWVRELGISGMQAEIVKARELGIPVYALLKEDPYIGVVQTPST